MNTIGYISQADLTSLSQLSGGGQVSVTISKEASGDNTIALVAQQEADERTNDLVTALNQLLSATAYMESKSGQAKE